MKQTVGAWRWLTHAFVVWALWVGGTQARANPVLDATGVTFRFGYAGQVKTPEEALGTDYYAEGTWVLYQSVATIASTDVDAVVTFVSGINLGENSPSSQEQYDFRLGKIRRIDYLNDDPFLEHSVRILDGVPEGSAEMQIAFFVGGTYTGLGTGTPVTLTNLTFNVYDIDGDQAIEVAGVDSYSLSNNTHLTVTTPRAGALKFSAPSAGTSESTGTAYTVGRAEVILKPTSALTYRMFFPGDGSGSLDLDFSDGFPWEDDGGGTKEDPTPAPSPPSAPSITSVTPGNATLTIAFTPPTDDGGAAITACSYLITVPTNFTAWTTLTENERASGTFTIPSLTNGVVHAIQLRCSNEAGDGASASGTGTPRTTPAAPTITSVTPGNATLAIAFTPPTDDGGAAITGCSYRLTTPTTTAWTTLTASQRSNRAFTITNLANGVLHTTELRCSNAVGDGASASGTGTPRTIPGAPTITSVTPDDTTLTIAFAPPTDDGGAAITGCSYRITAPTTTAWTTLTENERTSGTFTIPSLPNGVLHTIQLRCTNVAGDGPGTSGTDTPRTIPGAPTITSVTPDDTTLTIAFAPPTDDGGAAITACSYRFTAPTTTAWTTLTENERTARTFAVGNLGNGVSHEIELRCSNVAGDGPSDSGSGTPRTIPTAPTITSVTASSATLTVTFTPPSDDGGAAITSCSYRTDPENDDKPGAWILLTESERAAGIFTIPNLTKDVRYGIELRCRNEAGDGPSATAGGTPIGRPDAPTITHVTAGNGTLTVTFTPPSQDGGVTITTCSYRTTAPDTTPTPWTPLTANERTTRTFTIRNLGNGVPYQIDLRCDNALGEGPSTTATGTPIGTPDAPTITHVTAGNGTLTVTFTPPSQDGGVTITTCSYRTTAPDTTPTPWTPLTANERTTRTFTIRNLTNGVPYQIDLRCSNAAGDGGSATRTGIPVGPPAAPTITMLQPGDGALIVDFTPPVDDGGMPITNHQVQIDGGAWTSFDPAITTSPAVIPGLTNDVPATVRLRAVNDVGPGPASNAATATPRTWVGNVRVLPGNGSATILFDRYPGASGMEIQLSTASTPSRVLVPWRATTSDALHRHALQVTDLANGVPVCVQVRAIAMWDERSAATAPVCFTPTATPALPVAAPELLVPEGVQQVRRDASGAVLLHFDYIVKNTSDVTLENIWVRALDLPPGATVVSLVEDSGPGALLVFPWHVDHWFWENVNLAAGASRTLTVTIRVEGDHR